MIGNKQKKILAFGYTSHDAIICDGAVRSGKTSLLMVSFVDWAMRVFDRQLFGICGKTVDSATKNIVIPYTSLSYAKERYDIRWRRMDKVLEVRQGSKINRFEIFGGKDESSFMLIQGRTFAGCLLDEVVLMPESFVNQALARCSVDGSKLWFSCNPGNPAHWFYQTWIKYAKERNAYYLHFTMKDNPSLSEKTLARYESMYTGVFYQRYILGKWVMAEGLIYPMFAEAIEETPNGTPEKCVLSIDYGTLNAFAAALWVLFKGVWYIVDEYYYSGRDERVQKTDEEYAQDLDDFTKGIGDENSKLKTIIDPSAASFIALLRKRRKYHVIPADNAVLDGIRETATCLKTGKIKVSPKCENWKREVQGYVWDEKCNEDRPIKQNDHLMDAMRYFVKTLGIAKKKDEYIPTYLR